MKKCVFVAGLFFAGNSFAVVIESGEQFQQSTSSSWTVDALTLKAGGTILQRSDNRRTWFLNNEYFIEGGVVEAEMLLDNGSNVTISDGIFDKSLTIDRLADSGTLTITGGTFNQSVAIYRMQGDLVVSGGQFNGSLHGTTSYTSGAQPQATFIGSNWTFNNQVVEMTNGEAILPSGSQGTLNGILTDGNAISMSVGYQFNPVTITLRDQTVEPVVTELNGQTFGLSTMKVTCINETSLQSVTFNVDDGQNWDCKAQGLAVSAGDEVKVLLGGLVK